MLILLHNYTLSCPIPCVEVLKASTQPWLKNRINLINRSTAERISENWSKVMAYILYLNRACAVQHIFLLSEFISCIIFFLNVVWPVKNIICFKCCFAFQKHYLFLNVVSPAQRLVGQARQHLKTNNGVFFRLP